MKNLDTPHVLFLVLICWTGLAIESQAQEQPTRSLSLEDIHFGDTYASKPFRGGRWAKEGPVLWFIERDQDANATHLMSFNLQSGQRSMLIDGTDLYAPDVKRYIAIEDYAYSSDGKNVLLYTDSERVWRRNTKGYYYIYNTESREIVPLSDREAGFQMFAKLNAAGDRAAFVRNRNVFMVDLNTMTETQLTDDGAEGTIINGTSDWVYEEEFGLRDGWAWSPDGQHIAFFKLDESETRDFFMTDLLGQYPDDVRFRYPKAGEVNSEVQIGVVDVATKEIRYFDTDTWFEGGDTHEYIPQMGWTPAIGGQHMVWMIRLNRDQNVLDLIYGDPETATTRVVLHEEEPTWIDVNSGKIQFLADNTHFVWMSEEDGYRHIYLHANEGTRVRQVTSGPWEVAQSVGIDEEKGVVYFTGTIESPLERHLYVTSYREEGAVPRRITTTAGTHRIDLSKDARYYIDTFSSSLVPPTVTLHTIDGKELRVLEENERLKKNVATANVPKPEFIAVPGADGTMLNAYLIKPSNFDPSISYPLVMYVYGGPGSQTVVNAWGGSRYLWHAMLADELNVVVASVDNRGTGARGKDFKSATYKQLGQLEASDQQAAAKHLRQLDYIDQDRIGIWGWSYGGYMTLMSMLTNDGPDVFKFGASVAPVTDWRQYDTIYTERYMSTPQKNESGYVNGAPLTYADRLKTHQRLLLVHGDFDDNVHFQNAAQMANAFQAENKQFDFMMYPGRNHGIFGGKTRLHLFTMMTQFIQDALNDPSAATSSAD